jgi:hypothetical protein
MRPLPKGSPLIWIGFAVCMSVLAGVQMDRVRG